MTPSAPFQLVSEFLDSRREPIIARWLVTVRRDPTIPSADDLPRAELLDHLPAMLGSLSDQLRGLDPANDAKVNSQVHGEYRWGQNYTLAELLKELAVLRDILVAEFSDYFRQHADLIGTEIHLQAQQCLHRYLDGEISHSVSAFVERQQAEIQQANDALQELDGRRLQMLRTVAHELGNHLQGLAIITAVVQKQEDWANVSGHLSVLDESVRSMALLTQQLLEYAGLLAGKEIPRKESCDLAALQAEVADYLRALTGQKNLQFETGVEPGLPSIQTDRGKLQRICMNLGMNAIKYTDSGTISLYFRKWGDHEVAIEVGDTGPGIAPDQQKLIYHEFYRVPGVHENRRGAGLGLAITARLVNMLGARIELDSVFGRGSRFRVILPLDAAR